jgi:glycosyltransferase involved in cell wall biosynthesis
MIDFTIITPVYNGELYIKRTIESVFSNFAKEFTFEYLIINDGSTDSTKFILNEFASHPNIEVFHIPNGGEAEAVNFGLQKASGKYVLIVNADDPLITSVLFISSFRILEENSDVVLTYPDWKIISQENIEIDVKKLPDFSLDILIGEFRCLPGPGAIFRRDTALKVGGRNKKFKYVSDYDFWLRMSREGVFHHLPSVLAQWRQHDQSASTSGRGFEMGNERILVMKEFLEGSNLDSTLAKKAISQAYYQGALLSYFSKDVPGRKWMIKALILRRGWIEKSDFRIVIFCLFLPISRLLVPILGKIPLLNSPLRKIRRSL